MVKILVKRVLPSVIGLTLVVLGGLWLYGEGVGPRWWSKSGGVSINETTERIGRT